MNRPVVAALERLNLLLASLCMATVRQQEEYLGKLENVAWYYAGLSLLSGKVEPRCSAAAAGCDAPSRQHEHRFSGVKTILSASFRPLDQRGAGSFNDGLVTSGGF